MATTSGSGEPGRSKRARSWITDAPPPAQHQLSSTSMAIGAFNTLVIKTLDAIDVAAKYFVYKLYEAAGRRAMQWSVAAWAGRVTRRPFPGQLSASWVILQDARGKPLDRMACADRRRAARGPQGETNEPRLRDQGRRGLSASLGPAVGPVRLGGLARISSYQLTNGGVVLWLRKPALRSTREPATSRRTRECQYRPSSILPCCEFLRS